MQYSKSPNRFSSVNTARTAVDVIDRYNINKEYVWNFDHAPVPVCADVPTIDGQWTYCGQPVDSPLGVAAGPLLNGRWLLYYASLGFDILTYKTVRGYERLAYGMPNLKPIIWPKGGPLPNKVNTSQEMEGNWAISFGMPSKAPRFWQDDVTETRKCLAKGKFLCVSVVATPSKGNSIDDVATDYARCARWAVDSGADGVEANFSCPNVSSVDGQLYLNATDAGVVASRLREAIPDKPLLLKVGHFIEKDFAQAFFESVSPHIDGLVMVNGFSARVQNEYGELLFKGRCRGIGGEGIRGLVFEQLAWFDEFIRDDCKPVRLVGVGGLTNSEHVRLALQLGCEAVQFATAAMLNPALCLEIKRKGF